MPFSRVMRPLYRTLSSPGSRSSPRRAGSKRAHVDAAVPARDALGADAEPLQRGVGGGAGREDEVAGAVEGAHRGVHRAGEARVAGAQAGVGGELGVVAAEQRQAQRAGEQRPGDADRARGADVDQVEAPSAIVSTAAGRLGTPIRSPG